MRAASSRCNAGLINRLTPGRFSIIDLRLAPGDRATLTRAIRHPDVRFVAFPDRLPGAAEAVAAAGCDLLYHWEVGTDTLNYFLPFARPAPVQCTSWGVQVTTGVPAIDYYISSALVEAAGGGRALQRDAGAIARASCPIKSGRRGPTRRPTGASSACPGSAHLYACLQRPLKMHPAFDALLAGILRRDPDGLIVLLKGPTGIAAAQVAERQRATIPDVADRIVWLPFQRRKGYHRLLSLADAVLDPTPYGSGSSAYDIFSHDLPLVTLPGPYNAGRYALACYRRMGMMDLVASTPAEYVEIAVRLGTGPRLPRGDPCPDRPASSGLVRGPGRRPGARAILRPGHLARRWRLTPATTIGHGHQTRTHGRSASQMETQTTGMQRLRSSRPGGAGISASRRIPVRSASRNHCSIT